MQDGLRGTAATNRPFVHLPNDTREYGAIVKLHWQEKTEELRKDCPSAILSTTKTRAMPSARTRVPAAGTQRLTAWIMARTSEEHTQSYNPEHGDGMFLRNVVDIGLLGCNAMWFR
jgi:hypothetical protein